MSFPSFDEVADILDEAAERIPEAFYKELNLGIHLEPRVYLHPEGHGDLYVLGEYEVSQMGCKISIFYGSFEKVFAHASRETIARQLDDTLRHEFRHHMEHRAMERGLEREDEEEMRAYHHQYARRMGEDHAIG